MFRCKLYLKKLTAGINYFEDIKVCVTMPTKGVCILVHYNSGHYNRFIGSHSERFNVFPWNQQRQSGQGNANEADYAVFMRPLGRPCHYESLVDALFF